MRQSEQDELLIRTDEILDQVTAAARHVALKDGLAAQFSLGAATAYLKRLKEDIAATDTYEDRDEPWWLPKLQQAVTAGELSPAAAGREEEQAPPEDETGAAAAEQETEETEDVILPEEEEKPVRAKGARVKAASLPKGGALPETRAVRVPDEELPKPKRRRGRSDKFTLTDDELPDAFE